MKRKIDEPEVSRATLNPSGSSRVLSAVVLPGDVLLDRTSYLPLEARRISRMLPHRTPSQRARVILWHPRVPHPRNRSSKHHPNLCDPSLDILPSIHLSIVTSKHFLPLPFHSFSLSFSLFLSLSSSLSFALARSLSLSLSLSLSFFLRRHENNRDCTEHVDDYFFESRIPTAARATIGFQTPGGRLWIKTLATRVSCELRSIPCILEKRRWFR